MTSLRRSARPNKLQIMYAVADELNGANDLRTALERTLVLTTQLLRLRAGWIWLIDPKSGRFYNAASHNLPPYLREPVRMAGTWCQCTEAFTEGKLKPQNVDVIECSRLEPAVKRKMTAQTMGLRYHASIPLYFRGKPLGVMNLTGPSWRKLTAAELKLLTNIALQLGATIERARLVEDEAKLARIEERTRLAREIHDTLAQRFTAIALQLEGALKHERASTARARLDTQRALIIAREGVDEARRSVLTLRGEAAHELPLVQALESLARSFTARTGIPVRVEASSAPDLPRNVENELLRIAQEALTNIGKHAAASLATITLRRSKDGLSLSVEDNGKGLRRRATGNGGHGLVGMRERAQLLRGTLRVSSGRSGGTVVQVRLPAVPR